MTADEEIAKRDAEIAALTEKMRLADIMTDTLAHIKFCPTCADRLKSEMLAAFRPQKEAVLKAFPEIKMPERTMEIVGVDGKVHYRRPAGDPLIAEALKLGLTVREMS